MPSDGVPQLFARRLAPDNIEGDGGTPLINAATVLHSYLRHGTPINAIAECVGGEKSNWRLHIMDFALSSLGLKASLRKWKL